MKTIFIAYTLKNSSVAEFFSAMANSLARDNKVIIISYQTEFHSLALNDQIEVLEWPSKRPTGAKDFLFLSNIVRKHKPSMMISNFAAVNLFLLVGFLFKVEQRIGWYHTHSSAHLKESFFHKIRKRYIYKLATQIITISNSAKLDLINHYNVSKEKIRIIPNAVSRPKGLKKSKIEKKLLYVGRLHPLKGFETFLRALPNVFRRHSDYKVIVLGGHKGGKEIQEYEKMADELGVLEYMQFRGFTSRQEVMKELSSSYLCVVPSYFEAFCYVVIESFSVGTPVIGSNTTAIAEIIRNGIDGFLFEPGNGKELSEKIIELIEKQDLRQKMSENCEMRYLENFELETVVEGNIDLLNRKRK